jgi:hypothetical protein
VPSSGIEPTTFLFVAMCLNQLCYCVPQIKIIKIKLMIWEEVMVARLMIYEIASQQKVNNLRNS